MLNFLRHISDQGNKELVLKMNDFEYHVLLILVGTSDIIVKSRTRTDVTIIVEKP